MNFYKFSCLISILLVSCDRSDFRWDLPIIPKKAEVSTLGVQDVSNTGARISCEVTDTGGGNVLERGVCWSSNPIPTKNESYMSEGGGLGPFHVVISGLLPNTTYYVAAYAHNDAGTAYGEILNFKTTNIAGNPPTLTTSSVTQIDEDSALSGGNVTSDGGSAVSQRGVCWSSMPNPDIADSKTYSGSGVGQFNSNITGLNANTTYYVRAFATNSVGIAYGNQVSFTTVSSGNLPEVTTSTATSIGPYSAVSGGNVISAGGLPLLERGICWSTSPSPTTANFSVYGGTNTGSFISTLTNLSPSTLYYARAYATNSLGTAYGNQISFSTSVAPPTLVATEPCNTLTGVTSVYFGMNGTSSDWGISTNGHEGSCWVAPNPNASGQLGTVVGANHYVSFNRTFQDDGYLEFWVNTSNPGFDNLIPTIVVDNVGIGNAIMIDGNQSSFYWMKVRTPEINAGTHNIKILLSGSYYVLKVDEIDFFEF